ncbi:MAG: PAS domain-containing protein [Planctomycetota bacterium]
MDNIVAGPEPIEQPGRHLAAIVAAVIEQVDEAVSICDPDGTIGFVNTKLVNMLGYVNKDELVGRQIDALRAGGHPETKLVPLDSQAECDKGPNKPIELVRKDGTTLVAQVRITAVRDEQGRAIGHVVFAEDTSEQQSGRDELNQRCEKLEQCLNEVTAELTAAKERLQREIDERMHSEEELLEGILETEDVPAKQTGLFSSQELKALSELAKRLT